VTSDCKRPLAMEYLSRAISRVPGLTLAEKLYLLWDCKSSCPCLEKCHHWETEVEAACAWGD